MNFNTLLDIKSNKKIINESMIADTMINLPLAYKSVQVGHVTWLINSS